LNIGLLPSIAICFTGTIRSAVEYFTTRIYAANVSVYSALSHFKFFVIVRTLPGKEKKTAFAFGMLTKLLVVHFHMSAAAYCTEREREREREREGAFFDEKSAQFRY
jgi:hypothetical protein